MAVLLIVPLSISILWLFFPEKVVRFQGSIRKRLYRDIFHMNDDDMAKIHGSLDYPELGMDKLIDMTQKEPGDFEKEILLLRLMGIVVFFMFLIVLCSFYFFFW